MSARKSLTLPRGSLFDRVDANVRELRFEMNERFNTVDARFDAMQLTMLGLLATTVVGFLSMLGGILATQL